RYWRIPRSALPARNLTSNPLFDGRKVQTVRRRVRGSPRCLSSPILGLLEAADAAASAPAPRRGHRRQKRIVTGEPAAKVVELRRCRRARRLRVWGDRDDRDHALLGTVVPENTIRSRRRMLGVGLEDLLAACPSIRSIKVRPRLATENLLPQGRPPGS